MQYGNMLRFQKCLFINFYLYIVWVTTTGFFLYQKVLIGKLGHLSKYLSITVFTLLTVLEAVILYLGHYGNLSCRVPELAGFLMLTILMQIPLISFFIFNPYLINTPTEVILHAGLGIITLFEIVFCYKALKQASSVAKSIYLSHTRNSSIIQ